MAQNTVGRTRTAAAGGAGAAPSADAVGKLADQALKHGAVIEKKGNSYYVRADVQTSAAGGPKSMKVDRELAEAITRATEDRGTWKSAGDRASREINSTEMQRILKKVVDGGRYGEGEAVLVRMLFAATDDRKSVKLNGRKIELTGPVDTHPGSRTSHGANAESTVKHEMHKFWGTLGAKVRWSEPAVFGQE
ncbi:MAG: hypothetical protein K1X89_30305 [Myxococcaceae bacterium]|nr:hypothetical protein [Myxococcaceae bacterium]